MFRSARLKLTGWYLFMILFVSCAFSLVIYKSLTNELDRIVSLQQVRIERRTFDGNYSSPVSRVRIFNPGGPPIDAELVEDFKLRLSMTLLFINLGIGVLATGLGYLLAGRTLSPIKVMMEEQNRFISDSSHELRTPMTSLRTALEVGLRDKSLSIKEARELMTESIDEVDKMQQLSDQLLQLAQYQHSSLRQTFSPTKLKEVLRDAVKRVAPLAKKKNIALQLEVTECAIIGNQRNLSELFTILLDNAVKYSDPSTEVKIEAQPIDGVAHIVITDQGAGIEEKDLGKIFNRFYRADASRTRVGVGGYGLGLAIAKQIVELHHGKIKVKSTVGEGTTFLVSLPLQHEKKR